ncbi:TetR/AcrR family transcriptional regulator [Tannerella forsythia]|uniref:TetR/AcrR family transcriptional regulator n=1 Tax=Tannerella forsythia TaxID=28112 RepID=UPI000618A699|nr:TetR/AcrR family transcriptional regulator [Tannerella forsythia]BAR48405.1 transcriptional regulator, TetR family [Tannerella forsythia 3313]
MKDRERTEKKILDAVGSIIAGDGFEGIGINAVAQQAGVSKMLIYRYFEGLNELISSYLLQKDYWVNTNIDFRESSDIGESLKRLFREQIRQMRGDITLRRLHRWELSTANQTVRLLRERRERNGCELVKAVGELTHSPHAEVASLASILSASISYLVLMEEQTAVYNGIDLQSDTGWEQVAQGIDLMIDLWMKHVRQ